MTTAEATSKPRTHKRPRWLAPVIIVVVLMTSALALTVLARSPQANTDDLDPANPNTVQLV
jgi:hypothetical protein